MPCEIIGLHFHADSSELHPVRGVYDLDFVRACAIAHEKAGFDRILIGQTATWPDGFATASYIAGVTSRIHFMVAHRPGFIAPTMAARMFATLDQISAGRASVHIITGASDIETQCDGDFLTKDERYRRSREYVDILRTIWTSSEPVDHDGSFYRFKKGFSEIKPVQSSIPIFWGGGSDLAIELGAQCADMYALGPDTLARTAETVARIKREAARSGRDPHISMSMRIIVADTEEKAWAQADHVQDTVLDYQARIGAIGRDKGPDDPGRKFASAMAALGTRVDDRLWTGITQATAGRLHATALVGTARQVADALLAYYDVGVDRLLLNGFDTLRDVEMFGRELIPMIRAGVAERDARLAAEPAFGA
jgi:alkanesulfonate monooxygenase